MRVVKVKNKDLTIIIRLNWVKYFKASFKIYAEKTNGRVL